ncbi:hypothetical protein ACKW6Q_00110 [Chryseobacterium kwangjuense]|uniref:YcxB-like protein domain-containing protein n=1 Tax=Chryseobacterium kwangjuense TaxID=267125 RepID=A0ABW9JW68_9FLAO
MAIFVMRTLKNLDINSSIESNRLVFKESWSDRLDTFFVYFAFFAIIFLMVLCFSELESFSKNGLEYIILISIIIFYLYALYCKLSEKKLKKIKFNIHREEAKKRIIEYGKKYKFRISKPSDKLIFLNEPTDNFSIQEYERTIIIFFKENEILYTLIKEGARVNFPVLFSQHFTKRAFKKILTQPKIETTKNYFNGFFNEL